MMLGVSYINMIPKHEHRHSSEHKHFYVPTLSRFANLRYDRVCDEISVVLDYSVFLDREFVVGRSDMLMRPWIEQETSKPVEEFLQETDTKSEADDVEEVKIEETYDNDVKCVEEEVTDINEATDKDSHIGDLKEEPVKSKSFIDPVDDVVHRFLYMVSPTYSLLRSDKRHTFLREFRNHIALCIGSDVKNMPHMEGRLFPRFTKRVQTALWRVMDRRAVQSYRARLTKNAVSEIDRVPEMNEDEDATLVGEYLCHRFYISIVYGGRLLYYYPSRYVADLDNGRLTEHDVYRRTVRDKYAELKVAEQSVASLRNIALMLGLRVKNGKKSDYVEEITRYLTSINP